MGKFNYIMIKTVRFTGWPLFFIVVIYLVTGYSMAGQYGFGRLIRSNVAQAIHQLLHVPLLALFVVHSLPAMYLAFWRWGWIGKNRKT